VNKGAATISTQMSGVQYWKAEARLTLVFNEKLDLEFVQHTVVSVRSRRPAHILPSDFASLSLRAIESAVRNEGAQMRGRAGAQTTPQLGS
jgi:hypothetical protein